MDVEDLQSPEKVSTKWIKNLNSTVNKMNNTQLPMINMKPKDSIKLDIGRLGQTYPEKKALSENGLYTDIYQLSVWWTTWTKDEQLTLSGVKNCID